MNAISTQIEIMRQYRNILARHPKKQAEVAEADALIAELKSTIKKARHVRPFMSAIPNRNRLHTKSGQIS